MVKSNVQAGLVIERALKRAGMLAVGKWELSTPELLEWLHASVIDVAQRHFETDKEDFYEPRPMLAKLNGKFASSGASYDASTKRLTVTMTPAASLDDVGCVVTMFDGNQTPNQFLSGTITSFIGGSPTKYEVSLFVPVPTIASGIVNVTVGDWVSGEQTVSLLGENQVFSNENMQLFDLSNNSVIEVVDYTEFEFRRTQSTYRDGNVRWARYRKSAIDIASGSDAPALGTLTLSAYFEPPCPGDFDSQVSISDVRISEVEERLLARLLGLKFKQQPRLADSLQEEVATTQLRDADTQSDVSKVR